MYLFFASFLQVRCYLIYLFFYLFKNLSPVFTRSSDLFYYFLDPPLFMCKGGLTTRCEINIYII